MPIIPEHYIHYPFPLQSTSTVGVFAHLYLPRDLTAEDVKRLVVMLQTLAPDSQQEKLVNVACQCDFVTEGVYALRHTCPIHGDHQAR